MDIFAYRVIPGVVINDPADAEPLGQALIDGGLPVAEVMFRSEAAAESIAIMSDIEGLAVGAGTVLSPAHVELAVEAGACFLVSPGVRADVIREAHLTGKTMIPGAVTPGEIMAAQALGLDLVEFFPVNFYGGVAGIQALSRAFATTQFLPAGGITEATMAGYLALSCVPAVGGTWMVPPELLAAKDFAAISALCRKAVALAASV
ncbi:MAG: bifunctional 4-hydroxy-2-oxoglutarate aldolase/2-dehydro-3-deoxy-phosphogluconate aldolase [Propionibacteriaceae bacterium]|nr:bifunctional 4-hydroxy-2-oxoglutarate aldolase/2-dehydro-3-deoxy-phosphogluconate aldolase [Propionibacteriaceae bacterium]